jgi:hypothetical protein
MRSATIAWTAGAAGSVALTVYAGRHSDAPVVVVLIAAWVLTPFIALACAAAVSTRWSPAVQKMVYRVTFVIALGSLLAYAGAGLRAHPSTPVFVIVPPATWALILTALGSAALYSRR